MPPVSKETELGSSGKEASPSAGKSTRIVLVPCHAWKCVPRAISCGVDICEVPGFHFLTTDEFSVRVTNIMSRIDIS